MLDMADIITQNFICLFIYKQQRTNNVLEKMHFRGLLVYLFIICLLSD